MLANCAIPKNYVNVWVVRGGCLGTESFHLRFAKEHPGGAPDILASAACLPWPVPCDGGLHRRRAGRWSSVLPAPVGSPRGL